MGYIFECLFIAKQSFVPDPNIELPEEIQEKEENTKNTKHT